MGQLHWPRDAVLQERGKHDQLKTRESFPRDKAEKVTSNTQVLYRDGILG